MKKLTSVFDENEAREKLRKTRLHHEAREKLRKTRLHLNAHINLAAALMEPKPWVNLTHAEATELWERIDDRDSWELIMQVQRKLKEKNT